MKRLASLLVIVAAASPLYAQYDTQFEDDIDDKPWKEVQAQLPPYPQTEKLLEFQPGSTSSNRFFVDTASIDIGSDEVVRYALVVKTPNGATNVSFEGIRCATSELRLYAFGHTDDTWSRARNSGWTRIYNSTVNRHHAALAREYLCPNGIAVRTREEAIDALKRGGHPALPQTYR